MEKELKFQFIIIPETYDYFEEEIVYRIYFDDQLISERSLPVLSSNQGLTDNFVINFQKNTGKKNIKFINLKNLKKAKLKNIKINNYIFENLFECITIENNLIGLIIT